MRLSILRWCPREVDLEERYAVLEALIGGCIPARDCIISVGSDRIAFMVRKTGI